MLEKIIEIVYRAGDLIRDAHQIERDTREKNGAADLVTKYDVAVQEFLQKELLKLRPDADFFGEEGQRGQMTKDWRFIVDPIDGTTNFVRELNCSNIAVALCYQGEVRYAVVYNPFVGEMYAAEKGKGATLNGKPIHVSDRDTSHAIFACGSTIYDRSNTDRHFAIMRHLYEQGLDFRRFGSAELDLCYVAAGRMEIFFECKLSPWDYAAGSLIVAEAGGKVCQLDGSPLDLEQPASVWCTNDKCREEYLKLPQ